MRLLAPEDTAWQAKFLLSWHCKDSLAVEQEQHGDLLFLRTEETYYSLTPKVFRFFEYADTLGAEYTMKTDDDTFVFVDRVLSELKRMPKTCLYWGGSERLPSADAYRGSGIDIPLNKWYIDEDNFPLLAGTRYMAGGAYVLSRDLVHKIVRRRIVVPPHLPEDASVGRALGDAAFRLCRCSDTRHVKHVSDFQFVQLFHPAVHRCERGDVARRVLTMHGFKNLSQMDEVLSLATAPIELGCKVGKLRYTDWFTYKFWGRGFPKDAHAVNPIWSTSRRYHQLKKIRADPWERRHLFVSYEEDWAAGDGRTAGRTAVPRRAAASLRGSDLVPLRYIVRGAPGGLRSPDPETGGGSPVPWCYALHWTSQVFEMMTHLAVMKTLICDIGLDSFYVDITTMDLKLDRGDLRENYNRTRFHSDSVCFMDEQCRACFRREAKDLLPYGQCNVSRGRCVVRWLCFPEWGAPGDLQRADWEHHSEMPR